MFRNQVHEHEDETIDISPLIDVVFILLIFFMVTTTFQKDREVEINRPEAKSSVSVESDTTRVQIDAQGRVYFNGKETRLWSLSQSVKRLMTARSDKSVLVVADKQVSAELLVKVVDACRLGGAQQVGVATKGQGETG